MILSEKILQLLDNQESPVSQEWVQEMLADYPAFTLPAALLVKRGADGLDDEALKEIKLHLLLNSPDPMALADMVDLAGEDWLHLYPKEEVPATPSTESAISTFLDTYGTQSEAETAMLEQLIFNPVPADYFSEEEAPADGGGCYSLPRLFPNHKPSDAEKKEEKDEGVTVVTIPAASNTQAETEKPTTKQTCSADEAPNLLHVAMMAS